MQFLSLIGLVVLLGLAWAMSYHPRRVPLRTVAWGLGLQFVFALIILKQDKWSFIGMVVLAALMVVYIMQDEQKKRLDGAPGIVVVLLGAAAAGGMFLATRAAAKFGDQIDKTAARTGLATETVSAWALAAELGGLGHSQHQSSLAHCRCLSLAAPRQRDAGRLVVDARTRKRALRGRW